MKIEVKSKRIILKPFNSIIPSQKYLRWLRDEEISRYIIKSKYNSIDEIKKFLISMNSYNNYFFKIIIIKNSEHVGNIRIGPINFKNLSSKFGIMIGNRNYHGIGIGKEATKLAENFIFSFLNLKKMEFECITENIAAMNMYRSLNFNEKKIKRKLIINGNTFNQVIFYKYKS
tara:strand:- start:258 stop:776 length:519 start_codon:yes stop_codon:yes gene_type:complete